MSPLSDLDSSAFALYESSRYTIHSRVDVDLSSLVLVVFGLRDMAGFHYVIYYRGSLNVLYVSNYCFGNKTDCLLEGLQHAIELR